MWISLTASSKVWKLVLLFYVVNDNGGLFDGVYTGCHALSFQNARTCGRMPAQFYFLNLRKNLTFEHGTCKTGTFSYFLQHLTYLKKNYICFFIAISTHNSVLNFIKLNSDRTKNHF